MSRGNVTPSGQPSGQTHLWRRWLAGITAAGLGIALWTAIDLRRRSVTRAEQVEYSPVTGPLTFPVTVMTAPPELRSLYEFAARRPDVLHYLPCFCGCGRVHRSNYDCFIDEVRADGTVRIDEMSFT